MQQTDIKVIFDFFDVSSLEEAEEQNEGQKNMFCNLEFTLQHENIPTIWNQRDERLSMYKFRDP